MVSYLVLNVSFLAVVVIALRLFRVLKWSRIATLTLLVLLILTAIFDSLLVSSGIVAYDQSKILGVTIGAAPIEDLLYSLLAVIVVPTIWIKFGRKHDRKN